MALVSNFLSVCPEVVPIDDVELRSSWNGNVYALVLAKDDEVPFIRREGVRIRAM